MYPVVCKRGMICAGNAAEIPNHKLGLVGWTHLTLSVVGVGLKPSRTNAGRGGRREGRHVCWAGGARGVACACFNFTHGACFAYGFSVAEVARLACTIQDRRGAFRSRV